MTIGMQEIFAIVIVTIIVGFALFRRMRKKPTLDSACSACENNPAKTASEKPAHFFKTRR